MLVLSLFPGIGLLDMAFEEAGFCVVRGPDLLWGGDIRRFHPPAGRFDGVIGGPPCQAFSALRHINPKAGQKHGNLIPEFERCVAAARPAWFLMENVKDAPLPSIPDYHLDAQMLRDVWVGGETCRQRRFTFGHRDWPVRLRIETLALHRPDPEPSATGSGACRDFHIALGGSGKRKDRGALALRGFKTTEGLAKNLRLQGLPPDFLEEAPFTLTGKLKVVGNGVPLAMGRAVAAAVIKALSQAQEPIPSGLLSPQPSMSET